MTNPVPTPEGIVDISARVRDYTAAFSNLLDNEVAAVERCLASADVGTPWQPRLDEAGRMHPQVWEARREVQRIAGKAGLYAPHNSAEVGGGGFSRVEMHHIEEFVYRQSGLGLGLAALAWTEGPNPAIEHCSPIARERYLAPLLKGEITAAFANTEPAGGSDVLSMATWARRDGTDWILNGHKAWITNAHFADVLQVVAVTEPGRGARSLSMFLVDANAAGVRRGANLPTMMTDGLTGELRFTDVRVPVENVVGDAGDGFALAMSWINWRRLCRGGMCAGWGSWLVDRALRFSQQRRSGGNPISSLQAVQQMIADMDADVFQARATSLVAQAQLDGLTPFGIPLHTAAPRLISLVKLVNDEAFYRVADNAIQIRGALGLLLGSPEEKLFRVARNLRIPAGTVEIQRNSIVRGVLRSREPVA